MVQSDPLFSIKAALLPLYRTNDSRSQMQVIQDEFCHTLNWVQLSTMRVPQSISDLDETWERSSKADQDSRYRCRHAVFTYLRELGKEEVPALQMEAIYLVHAQQHAGRSADQKKPTPTRQEVEEIYGSEAYLVELQHQRELYGLVRRRGKLVSEQLQIKKAAGWQNIAIQHAGSSRCPIDQMALARAGVEEEVIQAKKQLKAVGIGAEHLGEAGQLFNLKTLAAFME